MFPVLHTFIHFSERRRGRRTASAPPDFHVHVAIADASRGRPRRRRRRAPADDEQTLLEFRKQACWEKWLLLAQRCLLNQRIEVRGRIALSMAAAAADMLVPTLRATLPTRLFMNVANCLGVYHVEFSILLCQGILQREGDNMQIWASTYDLKSSARMKTLISHAHTFQMLVARGEFALKLPTDDGPVCCAMALEANMTIDGLQGIASASSGIARKRIDNGNIGDQQKKTKGFARSGSACGGNVCLLSRTLLALQLFGASTLIAICNLMPGIHSQHSIHPGSFQIPFPP